MSQLRQYPVHDIMPVKGLSEDESPGSYVSHVSDPQSFGVVVARSEHNYTGTEPDQVSVLWSRQPGIPDVNVQVQTIDIKATSRKLKARWSVEHEEDHRALASMYGPGELEALAQQPGTQITYHMPGADGDCHVEVKTEKLVETPLWELMYAGDR